MEDEDDDYDEGGGRWWWLLLLGVKPYCWEKYSLLTFDLLESWE